MRLRGEKGCEGEKEKEKEKRKREARETDARENAGEKKERR